MGKVLKTTPLHTQLTIQSDYLFLNVSGVDIELTYSHNL